jgi:cell wall-associated NlpC family hydrolase
MAEVCYNSASLRHRSGLVILRTDRFALLALAAACFLSSHSASASSRAGASAAVASKAGEEAARTALRLRGTRYRYAGMSSRGVDCSGLIARVLMAHGIRAPHSSQALSRMGRAVARGELKPGDLVFFHPRGRRISHVGMYIGRGEFIHASSHARRVVVDQLNARYYLMRFVCARRLF